MNFTQYLLEDKRTNSTPFLIEKDRIVTYQDLCSVVNSLAQYILQHYGSGGEILLMADNSTFFVISYLAIIQSGNTVILLETRIGDDDLSRILAICPIRAFFVQQRFTRRFQDTSHLHTEIVLEQHPASTWEYPKPKEDDVAVIIFTSGSTGTKKGVMLTHANLQANTESIIEYLSLSVNDRICVVLPFYYCYGASLLHTHLKVGGSMVFSSLVFPIVPLQDLDRFGCTGLAGVPSTYQILINKTPFLRYKFPQLRYFAQAGGQLPKKYIEMILDSFPEKQLYVMYGATEGTARLSYLPPHLSRQKIGSIGKGIPGVTLEVLTEKGVPIQPGEVGEVVAQGKNIMKGYYRDPEETANVIREGKLYTGDLATIDDEGYIYIVGRTKNIIKSGGFRISPDEIEDFIVSLPGVQGCVVIGILDEIMGEAVVAVVQAESRNWDHLFRDIREACERKFPSYKIPQRYEFVSEFPLNASQKIDRPLLREMVMERRTSSS